jgi:transcription initiation factor TFIIH subunit 4
MAGAELMGDDRPPNQLNQTIFSDFAGWASTSPHKLDQLYSSPHAVQCVLRALPPVARLYVARVLYLPDHEPTFSPAKFRDALCRRPRARDRHTTALTTLRSLRVFVTPSELVENACAENANGAVAEQSAADDGTALLQLNPSFSQQLRLTVTCTVPPVFNGPLTHIPSRETADLGLHAAKRVERILNYPIGADDDADDDGTLSADAVPSHEIQRALASTHILAPCDGGSYMKITSTGFQFLLKDSFAQVWVLLRDVIRVRFAGAEFDALNFVFQLSFACCGRAYDVSALTKNQRLLAFVLDELGVIALDEQNGCFFPTQLGVNLVSSASRSDVESAAAAAGSSSAIITGTAGGIGVVPKTSGNIQVIVETNFRLYAYTTSTFQTNLLSLFTHMRYRLPNLVVGHLTREKVRGALMIGITADQIIGFLNSHAHPRMKNGSVPPTVRDEIKLWEAEQERVQFRRGFLLSDFDSPAKFDLVLAYANDTSACLWSNVARRQLIVIKSEYNKIRSYIKSL